MPQNKNALNSGQMNGFTLVEVLVAAAILAIGLLSVATMTSRSTIQDSRAYHTTQASMIIEEFLENATRAQYTLASYNSMSNASISTVIAGVNYDMDCDIQEFPEVGRCRQMTCTVNWNNKGILASTSYVYVFCPKY